MFAIVKHNLEVPGQYIWSSIGYDGDGSYDNVLYWPSMALTGSMWTNTDYKIIEIKKDTGQ